MPSKLRHPMPSKTDRKQYYPSRQASQHFSITATLNTGNTQKVGFVRRPISHLMSHRLPVNGNRCLSNFGTLRRRKTRPELVLPFTATVLTLFHNRHAKYRKYTESRLRSTTDQPPFVLSTSGQRQSMPSKLRHPTKQKKPTGNSIPLHGKRHNTFP
jgi:hypothetical protein